jgi:hypothetical protein
MVFNYEQITEQVQRPIIPIFLKSEKAFIIYRALIDSGADNCIFGIGLAELLEIELSPENAVSFIGVNGEETKGYRSEVEIRVGSKSYSLEVIFAEINDFGHGILGQRGFFDQFDVKMSYRKKQIEIE